MAKFRIVHVQIPKLSGQDGTVDYVPIIEYENEYHIEMQFDFYGLWKKWKVIAIYKRYIIAEMHIKLYKEKTTRAILKEID